MCCHYQHVTTGKKWILKREFFTKTFLCMGMGSLPSHVAIFNTKHNVTFMLQCKPVFALVFVDTHPRIPHFVVIGGPLAQIQTLTSHCCSCVEEWVPPVDDTCTHTQMYPVPTVESRGVLTWRCQVLSETDPGHVGVASSQPKPKYCRDVQHS